MSPFGDRLDRLERATVTGPRHQPPEGKSRRRLPRSRPRPNWTPPPNDDFLLVESSGTHREAFPGQRRATRQGRPRGGGTAKESYRRFLGYVERKRLGTVLNGATVLNAGTEEHPEPAVRHRHWLGLVVRLSGAVFAFLIATLVPHAVIALLLLAAGHSGVIAIRRSVHHRWALIIGGSELAAGLLLAVWLGDGVLRAGLVIGTLVTIALTVVAWQVDMEFITSTRLLVRTRGLFLLKRTVEAPLTSVRIADVTGPWMGLGLVTVDTTSDRDKLLHDFGLISAPNDWASLILAEANRPVPRHSTVTS